MLKNFFKDSYKYFVVKALISCIWLVSLFVFTRELSPEDFGIYSILLSVIAYAGIIATSWLIASLIRFYHVNEINYEDYVKSSSTLLFISLVVVSLILLGLLYFLKQSGNFDIPLSLIAIVVGVFIVSCIFNVYLAYLRTARRLGDYQKFYAGEMFFAFILGAVFLIYFDMGIIGIFLGVLISFTFYLGFIILFKKEKITLTGSVDASLINQMVLFGYPVIFINIFTQVLISSDQLMLRYFNMNAEVGMYAANYILAENSIFVLSSIIGSAFIPLIYKAWENDGEEKTVIFFRKVLLVYLIGGGALTALMFIFYAPIARLIIDDEFLPGSIIIPYVIIGAFFVGISNIFSEVFTIKKKTNVLMACYFFPAILNVVLNYFFIPLYGMEAAAITTMISYFCLLASVFLVSRRYLKI